MTHTSRAPAGPTAGLLLLGLLALAFSAPTQAATITWTGAVSQSWHTSGNWNLNRIPAAGDNVVIPDVAGTTTVEHVNAVVTQISSLNCSEGFHFGGAGQLSIAGTSVINGPFTMDAGTLTGNGNLTVGGTFLWTGGIITGTGTLTIPHDASWTVSPGTSTPTLLRVLNNDGLGYVETSVTVNSPGVVRTRTGGNIGLSNIAINGNGTFEIESGGGLTKAGPGTSQINCTFTNNGRVTVLLGVFYIKGPFTNVTSGVLTGGIYDLEATFRYDEPAITTLSGSINLVGPGSQFLDTSNTNALLNLHSISASGALTLDDERVLGINGELTTSGEITIRSSDSQLSLDDGFTQNGGVTRLEGGTISCNFGILINGGSLEGVGTVQGGLVNSSLVAPGLSPGILNVTGNYNQVSDGELLVEIGGPTPGSGYDRLAVSGSATLSGKLTVVPINGYTFPGSSVYDVITSAGRTGAFLTDNLPVGGGADCVDLTYTATQVRLVKVPCPDTLYVNATAPPGGNGQSWATAFPNLTNALAAVIGTGEFEIWMAEGTYRPSVADRNASFQLKNKTGIYGGFKGSESQRSQRQPDVRITRLSGDLAGNDGANFTNIAENSLHVVVGDGADSTAVLDGVTISGGNADQASAGGTGAGVRVTGSGRPTLIDCTISGNSANGNGGGMAILSNASARLFHCTFVANRAVSGAGFLVTGTQAAPVVEACRFEGNRASSSGGGATIASSQMTMAGCEFEDNQANAATAANGGAVSLTGSGTGLTLNDCYFVDNSVHVSGTASGVPRGGAFAMTSSTTATFTRCLFLHNSYTATSGAVRGGAVGIVASTATFRSCKFLGNSVSSGSDGDGGAVATITTNAGASFGNCIFSGNTATHEGGAIELNGTAPSDVRNCTLAYNSAETGAAGIRISSSGTLLLANSILYGNDINSATNEPTQIAFTGSAQAGSSLVSNIINGWTGALGGSANFSSNPRFAEPNGLDGILGTLDDFLNLLPNSPAIDSGNNSQIPPGPAFDLSGFPRRREDACTANTGVGTAPIVDRGAYEFQGSCVTGVADIPAESNRPRVGLPAPNPTAGPSHLTLVLPVRGEVHVLVLDVTGRRVRRLRDGSLEAGEHLITWDGADDGGRRVAGGIYFVRVTMAEGTISRKIVVQ